MIRGVNINNKKEVLEMTHISFDRTGLKKFVNDNELGEMQAMVNAADDELRNGTGAGADFRDWLHLPTDYDKEEFARIKAAAKKIQIGRASCRERV